MKRIELGKYGVSSVFQDMGPVKVEVCDDRGEVDGREVVEYIEKGERWPYVYKIIPREGDHIGVWMGNMLSEVVREIEEMSEEAGEAILEWLGEVAEQARRKE